MKQILLRRYWECEKSKGDKMHCSSMILHEKSSRLYNILDY